MPTPEEVDALSLRCGTNVRRVIEALAAAGYKIMPEEPTGHMVDCMMRGFRLDEAPRTAMRDAYRNCMLGAAPDAKEARQSED